MAYAPARGSPPGHRHPVGGISGELVAQRPDRDAEHVGGVGAVAQATPHRLQDEVTLDLGNGVADEHPDHLAFEPHLDRLERSARRGDAAGPVERGGDAALGLRGGFGLSRGMASAVRGGFRGGVGKLCGVPGRRNSQLALEAAGEIDVEQEFRRRAHARALCPSFRPSEARAGIHDHETSGKDTARNARKLLWLRVTAPITVMRDAPNVFRNSSRPCTELLSPTNDAARRHDLASLWLSPG